MTEKNVTYPTTHAYVTLNTLSDTTKNVWIVLHGIGFLGRYFLKYFDGLNAGENYIIAPQAPSKYYLNGEYKHVGASWLTRENTAQETENVITYLNAMYERENIPERLNLIVLGFSQGVSIATRWVASRQLKCDRLILYAGGIPDELSPKDFEPYMHGSLKVTVMVGNSDKYLTKEKMVLESRKIEALFQGKAELIFFDGGHELKKELINTLV